MSSNKSIHVTYVKLEPYLGSYWRGVMRLGSDQPLQLPVKETEKLFLPYLVRNEGMERTGGKNSKGYYKDTTSYSECAVAFAMSGEQPPLDYVDPKIPTTEECRKLFPFVLPKSIILKGGDDMLTDQYFELSSKGANHVRNYIRYDFYYSLFLMVNDIDNANRDLSDIVEEFISDIEYLIKHPKYRESIVYSITDYYSRYISNGDVFCAEDVEIDSIKRFMFTSIESRKIRPVMSHKRTPRKNNI